MRATSLVKQIFGLRGVTVTEVLLTSCDVVIKLRLTRSRLVCPKCSYATRVCYDTRTLDSRWRHLDMGTRQTWLSCQLRRLRCPTHRVHMSFTAFCIHCIIPHQIPFLRQYFSLCQVMGCITRIDVYMPRSHR